MDSYVNDFKKLCGAAAPNETINVSEARCILLHITAGQIPVSKLVDNLGKCFGLAEICAKTVEDVEMNKRELPTGIESREATIKAMKAMESQLDKECSGPDGVRFSDNAEVYRGNIVRGKVGSLMGIHFFDSLPLT